MVEKINIPLNIRKRWKVLTAIGSLVLENRPGCIVEIGAGLTTLLLYEMAIKFDRKFYSCDKRIRVNLIGEKRGFSSRYIPFHGLSSDFIKQFNDTPAFCFIDGCHLYEVVRQDFWGLYEKLRPGGVITMHDTTPPNQKLAGPGHCQDAYKLRRELERRPDIQIISWPYPNHVGVSVVLKKSPNRWRPPECDLLYYDYEE